jgi:hypothetical protein
MYAAASRHEQGHEAVLVLLLAGAKINAKVKNSFGGGIESMFLLQS